MTDLATGKLRGINVLVAHHGLLFRQGVLGLLRQNGGFGVLGHVGDTFQLVHTVADRPPDVVLLDWELPGGEIEATVGGLLDIAPRLRIVLVPQPADLALLRRLVAAGVSGGIHTNADEAELCATIRAVTGDIDRVVISVSRNMVDEMHGSGGLLSDREVEVLALAAKGLTSPEIATFLFIAEGTVKRHLTNIYAKLDVKSRIQAVNKARLLGVLRREHFAH